MTDAIVETENSITSVRSVLFTSISVFAFFLLCSPLITTIFAGQDLYLLFASPLLASGLAALVVYVTPEIISRRNLAPLFNTLALVAVPISLLYMSWAQGQMDIGMGESVKQFTSMIEFSKISRSVIFRTHSQVMMAIGLPFFFYGYFIAIIFQKSRQEEVAKIYSWELLGMLSGIAIGCLSLEYLSFLSLLLIISLSSLLSLFFQTKKKWRFASVLFVLVAIHQVMTPLSYQPNRNIHWVARDYQEYHQVSETRRSWTTYAKVQTLKIIRAFQGYTYKVVSIGDGSGHAQLYTEGGHLGVIPNTAPAEAVIRLKPKTALVLFAGAGADLISMDVYKKANLHVTGVELNKNMIGHAMAEPDSLLPKFLKKKNIDLELSEGRLFLERDTKKYDAILYSWSGATYANYSGARLHTTQYTYTTEALLSALNHLNPGGYLIIFGSSKINILLSLFKVKDQVGINDMARSVVLAAPRNENRRNWVNGWDEYALLVKKGEWTPEAVESVSTGLSDLSFEVVVSPFLPESEEFIYHYNFLRSMNFSEARSYINQATEVNFDAHSDDHPFINSILPYKDLLNGRRWKKMAFKFKGWFYKREKIVAKLVLLIVFLSVSYFFGTLVLRKGSLTLYCNLPIQILLGFGSSAMIILYTYKAILFLGNPTLAVALAQSGGMFFSFLAAGIAANRSRFSKFEVKYALALLIFGAILFYFVGAGPSRSMFFTPFLGGTVLLLLMAPISFSVSFLYVKSLESIKDLDNRGVSFFIALNLLSASTASILTPVSAESYGIQNTAFFILCSLVIAGLATTFLRFSFSKVSS